jgi:hypothetical protein
MRIPTLTALLRVAIAIGRAEWNGKLQNFSRSSYWIVFVAAFAGFALVFTHQIFNYLYKSKDLVRLRIRLDRD